MVIVAPLARLSRYPDTFQEISHPKQVGSFKTLFMNELTLRIISQK
jgi:hypothetical protein